MSYQPARLIPEVGYARRKSGFLWLSWDLALFVFLAAPLLLLIYLDLSFLAWLRLLLGVLYVLVAPGYVLQATLFPRQDDLDGIERAGLTVGLSVGVNPLLALIVNALPWGLHLWPMAISLAVVVLVFSVVALARRLHLPHQDRFAPALEIHLKGWWAAQGRSNRRLYGLVAGALVITILSAIAITILPKPSEHFSEFYILGTEGYAENYPFEFTASQVETVTTGIINREGVTSTYMILVQVGGELVGQAGPISLDAGAKWEQPIQMGFDTSGDDQQVVFTLERVGQPSPYRTLRLWVNIRPPLSP